MKRKNIIRLLEQEKKELAEKFPDQCESYSDGYFSGKFFQLDFVLKLLKK